MSGHSGKNAALVLFSFVIGVGANVHAAPIAEWTFESSPPANSGPIVADLGTNAATAQASGSHVGAAIYSSPAGNGSSHSFSSTVWAIGDYYQFTASTTGLSNIELIYDQASSNTGPGQFQLQYSTDGSLFTNYGTPYAVQANAAPNPVWNSSTQSPGYTSTVDLSSISAMNNAPTVYFRLVDNSNNSASGGTVGASGGDRVDNVIIQVVPNVASLSLAVSTNTINDGLLKGAPASDFTGTATINNSGPVSGNYSAISPDGSLSLTGVGSSVPGNSSGTFNYGLSSTPTTYGTFVGNLKVTPSGTANDTPQSAVVQFFVGNADADNSNNASIFGPFTYTANVPSGGSFAGLSSRVTAVAGTGGQAWEARRLFAMAAIPPRRR